MRSAPIPDDEDQRLALLAACNILYTPAEAAYDDVAQLAADLCGTEIALITLVDSDYQWFKARVGIEQVGTSRDLSFCAHCIAEGKPMIVRDTHDDTRFADNPLVTGDPMLRFYAGVPLLVDGLGVGAISVADRSPRELSARQLDSLQRLAQQVSRELTLRRDLARTTGVAKVSTDGEMPVAEGDVVHGYKLERELGRGGAGIVFEALSPDGARVALKVLRPSWGTTQEQLERFAREARVLMRLTTPHVAKLYDVGNLGLDAGGVPFLVLELLKGADLAQLLYAHGPCSVGDTCAWIGAICDAVADAHDQGIIHRDLKPSNIFLARSDDGTLTPKILDFGIAAADFGAGAPRITRQDIVMGSPAYMAPEQMMGALPDSRTDIWSIGVVLYELLTGKLPFPGTTPLEIFAAAQARPAIPLSAHVKGIPPELQTLVSRCLRKKPEERTIGMRELARELQRLAV